MGMKRWFAVRSQNLGTIRSLIGNDKDLGMIYWFTGIDIGQGTTREFISNGLINVFVLPCKPTQYLGRPKLPFLMIFPYFNSSIVGPLHGPLAIPSRAFKSSFENLEKKAHRNKRKIRNLKKVSQISSSVPSLGLSHVFLDLIFIWMITTSLSRSESYYEKL